MIRKAASSSNARRGSAGLRKCHNRVGPERAAAYPRLTRADSREQKFLFRLRFLAPDHRPEGSVLCARRVATARLIRFSAEGPPWRGHFPRASVWCLRQRWGPSVVLRKIKTKLCTTSSPPRPSRHTVRSLLSRVTTPDIAELCVGHALKDIRKTYDHHLYEAEKMRAMEGLAAHIASIVQGDTAAK
jgi:hypothetical protein